MPKTFIKLPKWRNFAQSGHIACQHVFSLFVYPEPISVTNSVTRLGDLSHFKQLFKACTNNFFAQMTHINRQICKGVQIFYFSSEIIFGPLL